MKKLFLLLLVCLAALSAFADESFGLSYKVTGDSTVEVFRLNIRNVSVVTIPQTVTGDSTTYTVTSIGDYAFDGCYALTSVTIPNSVTSIGDYAFSNCFALTSVTLPDSVTSIGMGAFGNSALTSITIPDSVISIGDGAFEGTPLFFNKANWHNRVLYIGNHLISAMCKESYTIKDGTRTIADDAFSSCNKLKSVTIPNSVISIGASAFSSCNNLKSVTIPNSVISIGAGAFSSCDNLKSVTIPNSVISIGAGAFAFCSNLKSVTIPNSVTTIGNCVFSFCEKLKTITVENNNPANISLGTEVFEEVPTSTCVLRVPTGAKSLYAAADQWKEFRHIEQ